MDIAKEIRVWGAQQDNPNYWSASGAYEQFFEELEYRNHAVTLNGEPVTVISTTDTDEDYDGDIQTVFSVGDRFFAMDGTYSSWNGTSWNGAPYEVEAQPVTRLEYVRKR